VQTPERDFEFYYNRIWSKLQMLQWILVEVGEVVEELKKQYQMLKMRSIKEAMMANENA